MSYSKAGRTHIVEQFKEWYDHDRGFQSTLSQRYRAIADALNVGIVTMPDHRPDRSWMAVRIWLFRKGYGRVQHKDNTLIEGDGEDEVPQLLRRWVTKTAKDIVQATPKISNAQIELELERLTELRLQETNIAVAPVVYRNASDRTMKTYGDRPKQGKAKSAKKGRRFRKDIHLYRFIEKALLAMDRDEFPGINVFSSNITPDFLLEFPRFSGDFGNKSMEGIIKYAEQFDEHIRDTQTKTPVGSKKQVAKKVKKTATSREQDMDRSHTQWRPDKDRVLSTEHVERGHIRQGWEAQPKRLG